MRFLGKETRRRCCCLDLLHHLPLTPIDLSSILCWCLGSSRSAVVLLNALLSDPCPNHCFIGLSSRGHIPLMTHPKAWGRQDKSIVSESDMYFLHSTPVSIYLFPLMLILQRELSPQAHLLCPNLLLISPISSLHSDL